MIAKPAYEDAPTYCHYYFDLVQQEDLLEALIASRDSTIKLFSSISPVREDHAYASGKWTVKELLSHLIDCERILSYRALRFSRKDETELAGFDEDAYVAQGYSSRRNLRSLIEEYALLRNASLHLFQHMDEEMLNFFGQANKVRYSAKALGWMLAGHNLHHCAIIQERYMV